MNQYSFTYRLVRDGLKTTSDIISGHFGEPTAEQPQDTAEGIPLIMYRYSLNPGKQWQAAWTLTFKLVLALRDEVEAHGGHLAVILVPGREEEDPARWQQDVALYNLGDGWDVEHPEHMFTDFLEAQAIPYFNSLNPIRDYVEKTGHSIHFEIDPHFNTEGHCLMSVLIQDWLLGDSLINGPSDYYTVDPVATCAS